MIDLIDLTTVYHLYILYVYVAVDKSSLPRTNIGI